MNNTSFFTEPASRANLTPEQVQSVNAIFEDNFVIKKRNEGKIREQISEKLSVDNGRSKEIYNAGYSLLGEGIVGKLKHPFGGRE